LITFFPLGYIACWINSNHMVKKIQLSKWIK